MSKVTLQKIAVRTNFRPFTWIYRALYAAAIHTIVYVLKRQPGIISIYLVSSLAAGDCVYGLSDIDLVIVVDEEKETKGAVAKVYKNLSRLIPMLRYDELAVYDRGQIRQNYRQGDLWFKYKLFSGCKKNGKLLYGVDILRDFPEPAGIERNEPILGHLAFLWQLFLKNFLLGNKAHSTLQRNYLCYKLTSDSCKAFVSARHNKDLFNREKALEYAGEHLDGKQKDHVERIKALAKNRFSTDDLRCLSDTYDFCVSLLQTTIRHMPSLGACAVDREINNQTDFDFNDVHFILSDANRYKAERLISLIRRKYEDYIKSVLLSPFDLLHIGEQQMCIFIIPERPVPFEAVRELNTLIGTNGSAQSLYLYMLTPESAISLNRLDFGQIQLSIFLLQWMQITAAYLSAPSSVLFGRPLEYSGSRKLVKDYFVSDLFEWISQNETVARRFINDPDTIRLPAVRFQLFFWQALRLKLMEARANAGRVFMPLSSWQVCREYKGSAGFDFGWLSDFHEEYKKDLNGVPSDSEAYFQEAIVVLKKMYF